MSAIARVGQKEKITQQRVVALLRDALGYTYLGNWRDRDGNRNIEEAELRRFLADTQGYNDTLITRALHVLITAADNTTKSLYDRNHDVYDLLRYGVKVKQEVGENTQTVLLIDWEQPERNRFAFAEEVTVLPADHAAHTKRPDIVLYVNGIALAVLELKRSIVSVAEGIRQNLDNQKEIFIGRFFATVQLVMAGNDTEGLRYGVIETPEKYYLTWKEPSTIDNALDRALTQLCEQHRLLELVHDFIVFDQGTKKLCRPNQYFGVRAAQEYIKRREGGIIWHTQGSGKSLTMVWLAKWIREHVTDPRVLIITDRTELDEQIEGIFKGVNEDIYRTKSGADLIATLAAPNPWLICSLVQKFGGKEDDEADVASFLTDIQRAVPPGFAPQGNIVVFVDECHRTQSGVLHRAMKAILPEAIFIGFTGTPLLKADKDQSIQVFGPYIHTYKFDEAVRDGVVLDLRYEARDIDQRITSQAKIDQWFEAATSGLTDLAKAQLKQRWGTMQKVLSSRDRLNQIVGDIMMDMLKKPRLVDGHGNAMLVTSSIYQACKCYEFFSQTMLKGKCAIVTSYRPTVSTITGEESGEGETERLHQYAIYQRMLADWFHEPPETAVNRVEEFERDVKKKFIEEPGQMKLLIVVDKLLTGFDAPPATYLYIDKQMRDHGLFQAICRVNRLDGEDKEYGYIIDYKDLFHSLESAVQEYTSGALDGYDRADIAGLLEDRLTKGREHLDETREAVKLICEPVPPPYDSAAYLHFFCAAESGNADQLKANEQKRLALYRHVAAFVRAYANLASELADAGYTPMEIAALKADVDHYEKVRTEVKLASGDYIDLKMYEPAMRQLIDNYIHAEDSVQVSAFDDIPLVRLIVERGEVPVDALPPGIRESETAVAETIENNVRRVIIQEQPVNPKYYEKMSTLLDELIAQRRQQAIAYKDYLRRIAELSRQIVQPQTGATYPPSLNTDGKRSLYDNLARDEAAALAVDNAVRHARQDDWRGHPIKLKMVRIAIKEALAPFPNGAESADERAARILELVQQHDY